MLRQNVKRDKKGKIGIKIHGNSHHCELPLLNLNLNYEKLRD